MKKYLSIIVLAALALVSCQKSDPSAVAEVSLDQKTITVNVGESVKLVATVLPATAVDKSVTWTSDNEEVATVKDGVVTGVKVGSAKVTVTTTDGGKTAFCEITVKEITWTAVYTEGFDVNVLRTAFNKEGSWSAYSLNQAASAKGSLAFGYVDLEGAVKQTPNKGSEYASSYWDGPFATESWIVSPEIDLTGAKYAKMTFKESQMYHPDVNLLTLWATIDEGVRELGSEEGVWWGGPINVLPLGTWSQLSIPNHKNMTGENYDFIESGDVDLNDFAGEKIRIAFKYVASTAGAGTWNWDDIVVFSGE